MILDLLKFGAIFFLPTILGRAFKLFQELKSKNFCLISLKNQNICSRTISFVALIYIIFKLASISILAPENFFERINARIDSPSYIIRNYYRKFVESWAENDPTIKNMYDVIENESELNKFIDNPLYSTFIDLQKLSEQLKIKEKKDFYSKYGERPFLNCDYCTSDNDFLMYLVPTAILEYSLFLILIGALSANTRKTNWRNYGLLISLLCFAIEAYAFVFPSQSSTQFELYDSVFGDDRFTLRSEKIIFTRDLIFIVFTSIVLLFDNGKDSKLKSGFDQMRNSIETSLEFLRASRIQLAAISIDENLQKFVIEFKKKSSSNINKIFSDPAFRQKVAETGHKLNIEELILQKEKNIDELIRLTRSA
jgi:hypothetical protein